MKWFRRVLILIICLAFCALTLFFGLPFLNDFKDKGELKIPGLKESVTIQRDANGMAYIHAQNMEDLLMAQGFVTAIANPKGWAFMISLLPPFINSSKPFIPQIIILVMIIMTTEFTCLVLYSNGGRTLSRFLEKSGNVRLLNRISGLLMIAVGIWLGLG